MRRREDTVMQKLVEASVNQILGPPLDPSESSTLGKKRAREEDVMDVSSLFDVKGRVVVVTEGGSGAYLFILFHLPVHHAFLFELLVLCLSSSRACLLCLDSPFRVLSPEPPSGWVLTSGATHCGPSPLSFALLDLDRYRTHDGHRTGE